MIINLKVHASSSKQEVKKINEDNYEIWLKEKPVDNKANGSIMKLLKKYFKRDIKIKSGIKSNKKIVEIK